MTTDHSYADILKPSIPHPARKTGAARFFWSVSLLTSLLGGLFGFVGMLAANGAPQEAAAAAIGCLIVIAPYVLARAVDELTRT
jgi:hypothetical protein